MRLFLGGPGSRKLALERAKDRLVGELKNVIRETSIRMDEGTASNVIRRFDTAHNEVEKALFELYSNKDISEGEYAEETRWLDMIHARAMERFGKSTHLWGRRRHRAKRGKKRSILDKAIKFVKIPRKHF